MQLADELISGLGSEITTHVFFLWLAPHLTTSGADRDVDALLGMKLKNRRALRAGRRLAERMAESVADSLAEALESDSADDAANDATHDAADDIRLDATRAVARSLAETTIPDTLAVAPRPPGQSLSHVLRDLVREQDPAATDALDPAATDMYQRILDDACAYIVALVEAMPRVADKTLADILKREDELARRVDMVLANVRRELDATRGRDDETARFEDEYLQAIGAALGRIRLFDRDVPVVDDKGRAENISVAFRAVTMKRRVLEKRTGNPDANDPDANHDFEPVPMPRALQTGSRLLVRGPAGSGKTTILQWLAVTAAARAFPPVLQEWNHAIPFFVRLREYSDKDLPDAERLAEHIMEHMAEPARHSAMPAGWVEEQLDTGRALVLIDGLDEVPQARHGAVQDWLVELVETHPTSRFVLTTRPHAAEWRWLADHGFHDAYVQDMSPAEIRAFMAHWHACRATALQNHPDSEDANTNNHSNIHNQSPAGRNTNIYNNENTNTDNRQLEHIDINALWCRVRASRELGHLAANPLHCALICALDCAGQRDLFERPGAASRAALLERACDMLAGHGSTNHAGAQLSSEQARALVNDLALWMNENSLAGAWQTDVDARVRHALDQRKGQPDDMDAAAVRDALIAQSGVLERSRAGYIDYAHRSLQEFLAARAAVDERVFGLLVAGAHDDHWREVVVLAAGLARAEDAGHLIGSLLDRAEGEPALWRALVLVAARCLDAAGQVSHDIHQRVHRYLDRLVPPRDLDEAEILARMGDIVIEHLRYQDHREGNVSQVAACVRTLALVDSKAGMEALAEYAVDTRLGVFKEMWRALTRTEHGDEFVQRIAPTMELVTQSEEFSAYYWLDDLRPFSHLPHLKRLRLRFCTELTDLGPLASLPELTHLELVDCIKLDDLSPLVELPTLTSLFLQGLSSLADLSPVRTLTRMQSLFLQNLDAITDLEPLSALSELQFLYLWSCPNIADVSPLAALEKLTFLYVRGCADSLDLGPVKHVKTLVVA